MLTAKVILLKNMRSETQRYTTSMRKGCFFHQIKYIIWKLIVMTASKKQIRYIFYIWSLPQVSENSESFILLHPVGYNKLKFNPETVLLIPFTNKETEFRKPRPWADIAKVQRRWIQNQDMYASCVRNTGMSKVQSLPLGIVSFSQGHRLLPDIERVKWKRTERLCWLIFVLGPERQGRF